MALYWWQPPEDARRINFIINFHILSPFFIFCIVLWIHFHAKVQPDLKETKRGLATRNGIFLADLWHWVGKIIWTKRELCQLRQKPFHIKPMLFTGFIRIQSFVSFTLFFFLREPTSRRPTSILILVSSLFYILNCSEIWHQIPTLMKPAYMQGLKNLYDKYGAFVT